MYCAVWFLAVSRSDRQYGCHLHGGGGHGDRERSTEEKAQDEYTARTYRYLVHDIRSFVSYLVLLYVRKKAQRGTTQHRSAGQGAAQHRTAPHGAALRCRVIYSWAELGVHCDSTA